MKDLNPGTLELEAQYGHPLLGVKTESNDHKVISTNLKIVSLICNVFTISMCLYLVHMLRNDIKRSKSNAQKRKIELLQWSMAFILCFFANVLIIVFVPFMPEGYAIADLLMQFVLMTSVFVYFKHWEINLNLFVKNRFVLMLKAKSPANRLTFMARVMTRASKSSLLLASSQSESDLHRLMG